MKHLQKAEQKCSETTVYRYLVGGWLKLLDMLKKGCIRLIEHITELLMALSLVGIVAAAYAFDDKAINYTTAVLFITILAILIASLIKIKILENKNDKKKAEYYHSLTEKLKIELNEKIKEEKK